MYVCAPGFSSVTDTETAVSSRVGVRVSAYDASVARELQKKYNYVILETCVAMAVSALLCVSTAVLGIELGGHRTSIQCIHTPAPLHLYAASIPGLPSKCCNLLLNEGSIVLDGRWLGRKRENHCNAPHA